MEKGIKRVIIGIVLLAIGALGWVRTLLESVPAPNSPPIDPTHMFDSFPVIVVHSVIAGIGVWILLSGVKAYRSS